ncbi:unnamed protein product, partial [Adineta steineri]
IVRRNILFISQKTAWNNQSIVSIKSIIVRTMWCLFIIWILAVFTGFIFMFLPRHENSQSGLIGFTDDSAAAQRQLRAVPQQRQLAAAQRQLRAVPQQRQLAAAQLQRRAVPRQLQLAAAQRQLRAAPRQRQLALPQRRRRQQQQQQPAAAPQPPR